MFFSAPNKLNYISTYLRWVMMNIISQFEFLRKKFSIYDPMEICLQWRSKQMGPVIINSIHIQKKIFCFFFFAQIYFHLDIWGSTTLLCPPFLLVPTTLKLNLLHTYFYSTPWLYLLLSCLNCRFLCVHWRNQCNHHLSHVESWSYKAERNLIDIDFSEVCLCSFL